MDLSWALVTLDFLFFGYHQEIIFHAGVKFTSWYVSNANFPDERNQVMLAQGKHFDVFDNYHFIVIFVEYCTLNSMLNIVFISLEE